MAVTQHASGTQAATVGTEHLHAWAAGFFDGEGCIHIRRRVRSNGRFSYQLTMKVGQRIPEPVQLLQVLYGGHLRWRANHGNGAWDWGIESQKAGRALGHMLPYLIVKRAEAIVALEFQRRRMSGRDPKRYSKPIISLHREQDEKDRLMVVGLKRRGIA